MANPKKFYSRHRKLSIALASVAAFFLLSGTTLTVMFVPRKLSSLIESGTVTNIRYTEAKEGGNLDYVLSQDKFAAFLQAAGAVKYQINYGFDCLCQSPYNLFVTYENGKTKVINDYYYYYQLDGGATGKGTLLKFTTGNISDLRAIFENA